MPPLTTAKAYASAIASGLAAALGAALPFVDGFWSVLIFVVLAVLGAYGFTYAVPNASASSMARRKPRDGGLVEGVVDDVGRLLRKPSGGAPPA